MCVVFEIMKKKSSACTDKTKFRSGCDVGDAAGFFRGKSDAQKAKEAELKKDD